MRILIACEFSGVVRDAFRRAGHDAWSCDLLPTESPGPHLHGDVRTVLDRGWDLMVAHPPCTHLAVSGAQWFARKRAQGELFLSQSRQDDAIDFVRGLLAAPIPRIALENPVGILSTTVRPPDQIIQPWQFGHAELKTTCLWLRNLPPLVPTQVVTAGIDKLRVRDEPPSPTRWKARSRTYPGIAAAMAAQWVAALLVVVVWGSSLTAQEPPPLRLAIPPDMLRAQTQTTATAPPAKPRVDLSIPTVFYVASVSSAWAGASATCVADNICSTVTPVLPTVSDPNVALGLGLLIQGGALWAVHQWVAPRWPRVAQGVLYALSALHIGKAADHVLTSRRQSRAVTQTAP